MTIAISIGRKFSGHRYILRGELSRFADWSQTLELLADGDTVSITGQVVYITFRPKMCDIESDLTLSTTGSHITITDADTLTISATAATMGVLTEPHYYMDITSDNSGAITHWAHGLIAVKNSPVAV